MEELGKALTNRCRAVRELPNKKQKNLMGTRDRTTNSEQLEFECQLKTPTRGRIHELLKLGAASSQNLFQSLITNQDLLRLREDMWPSHKTLRKGWWCRAFATAINRQCPTCNRFWTTEQFPPSLAQCLTCLSKGTKRKPSQFKLQDSHLDLQIGSPGRAGRGESGRRCSSLSGRHQEMFIKHVDGPRQGYPADKK